MNSELYHLHSGERLPLHSGINYDRVERFITETALRRFVSEKYANRILYAFNTGELYGIHLTAGNYIRATFK